MEVNDLHFDILLQGGQYDVHFDILQYQVGYLLFYEYFYQVLDTTLMLPEITKVCKVEVNMISILTFCLWNIVEQHIILGVLGCLTHILDHNLCTLYRMSLLNKKWRSKWRQCSHSIYKESSTLKTPKNDTLLDYIASYIKIAPHIKIVRMEVTLTSTFFA